MIVWVERATTELKPGEGDGAACWVGGKASIEEEGRVEGVERHGRNVLY